MYVKKEVSSTLAVAGLFAAVLVVAAHNNAQAKIDISAGLGFSYLFQEFALIGMAAVSVPLFAFLSGFFACKQLRHYTTYLNLLKKRVFTIVVPYVLCSTLIFYSRLLLKSVYKGRAFQHPDLYTMVYDILLHPMSVQFWYLRDLILLLLLAPLLFGSRRVSYLLTMGVAVLWVCDYQPFPLVAEWYLISIDTLFFFCLGGVVTNREMLFNAVIHASTRVRLFLPALWVGLNVLRVWIDPDFFLWYNHEYTPVSLLLHKASILVGLVSIVQLAYLYSRNKTCLYLSGLTFFVYAFHHEPFSLVVRRTVQKIIPPDWQFFVSFTLILISVFVAAHLAYKYLPRTFSLLTGGRTPKKIVKRLQRPPEK